MIPLTIRCLVCDPAAVIPLTIRRLVCDPAAVIPLTIRRRIPPYRVFCK